MASSRLFAGPKSGPVRQLCNEFRRLWLPTESHSCCVVAGACKWRAAYARANGRKAMRNLIAAAIFGLAAAVATTAFADGPVDSSKVRKDLTAATVGKTYKIATVVKVDGIAWFERMRDGVGQFGKDTGHDTWLVGPSHSDAA